MKGGPIVTYISLMQLETRQRLLDEERDLKLARAVAMTPTPRRRAPRGQLRVRRLLAFAGGR